MSYQNRCLIWCDLHSITTSQGERNLKRTIVFSIFSASGLLASSANAADLDVQATISAVQQADTACTKGAQKIPIDGVKTGSAAERNQIQADNGWKLDGIKGKRYLILSTKQKGKLIPAASFGPVIPNVNADDFKILLKNKICMIDEG